ncbi:g3547 [Coccomyxa elongata]
MKLSATSLLGVTILVLACTVQATEVKEGRKILQYPSYGQSLGGATTDNNVGWSSPDANGYSAVTGVTCPSGQQTCHGRAECVDLQNNLLYCGSCSISCDSFAQMCTAGVCVCKSGLAPCPTYGGHCLDAKSCPSGQSTMSAVQISDVNTQDVVGTNPADKIAKVVAG